MNSKTILDYLSDILELVKLAKTYESSSTYSQQDVRTTFFAKVANALRVYYLGHDFEFIVSKLKAGENYSANEIPHIENLGWVMPVETNALFLDTYHSILKLNLLNGSWVCFESSIDEIFKTITTPDVRENIELRKYNQVAKLLKIFEINNELDKQLRDKLREKHIPANNKWNTILKLDYPTHRNLKQDRVFLEFFGSCRNCMHNNSISFKEAHFVTKFGSYDFYKGKAIDFISGDLIIKMVGELAEIFSAMCNAVKYEGIIIDPYSAQVENVGH